ncbi:MAG: hypothetical protein RLN79_02355 [Cytophagales bacterium]
MDKIWFEGKTIIDCSPDKVKSAFQDKGTHFEKVTTLMPGISSAELTEKSDDFIHIKTNEGLMKRNNFTITSTENSITIEFDELYTAGKSTGFRSHFIEKYQFQDNKVEYHLIISNVKSPGFLGFFYRNFGSSNIGKAFLNSTKKKFEN